VKLWYIERETDGDSGGMYAERLIACAAYSRVVR